MAVVMVADSGDKTSIKKAELGGNAKLLFGGTTWEAKTEGPLFAYSEAKE